MKKISKDKIEKIIDYWKDIKRNSRFIRVFEVITNPIREASKDIILVKIYKFLAKHSVNSLFYKFVNKLIDYMKALCVKLNVVWHQFKLGSYFLLYVNKFKKNFIDVHGLWIQTISIFACITLLYMISNRQISILETVMLISIIITGGFILIREDNPRRLWEESMIYKFLSMLFFIDHKEDIKNDANN
jgi:hypothetical protein